MDINRTHFLMAGVVILVLGLQFRMVQTYVLNEQATKVLAEHMKKSEVASANFFPAVYSSFAPAPRKSITPPKWIGWAFVSTGAVLVLHSISMPKQGG